MRIFRGRATPVAVICTLVALGVPALGPATAGASSSPWTVSPSTDVSPTLTNVLYADSCHSGGACTAVGNSTTAAGRAQTLVESWNGSAWSTVPSPDTGAGLDNLLYGVSCPSTGVCVAVGSATSTTGHVQNLAEVEKKRGSWSITPTPDTSTTFVNSLAGVSCAVATSCMAVGSAADATGSITLAESWNGSTWTLVPSPNVPGTLDASLNAVSCTAATACVAVGNYTSASGVLQTLTESWNGSAWTIVTSPDTTTAQANSLNGVSCTSAVACTAVGAAYAPGGTAYRTLVESWDGTAWSLAATPDVTAGDNELLGVACAGAASCTAVGYSTSASSIQQGLIESWDGTSWTVVDNPQPGLDGNSLSGTACVGTACVAVGSQEPGVGVLQTLIESDLVAPTIGPLGTVDFGLGARGSTSVTATGSPQPTFAISGGPAGVSIDRVTGVVSGSPTQVGTFAVTVTASNGVAPDATGVLHLVVPGLQIVTSSLPVAHRAATYATQLTATGGGTLALVWSKSGALPKGLQLSKSGLIAGTPSANLTPGNYPIKVTVTAGSGKDKQKAVATLILSIT